MAESDNWYYKLLGEEFGPVSFEGLSDMAHAGSLHRDDDVRQGDRGVWARADTVAGLFDEVELSRQAAALDDFFQTSVVEDDGQLAARQATSPPTAVESPPSPAPVLGWYCEVFGQELGPLSFEDLEKMVENGELSAHDKVKEGTDGKWTAASRVQGLYFTKSAFTAAPMAVSSAPSSLDEDETDFESTVVPRAAIPAAAPLPNLEAVAPEIPEPAEEPAAPEPKEWYCRVDGTELGPLTLTEMAALAEEGRLTGGDDVRRGRKVTWFPATVFPELASFLPTARARSESVPLNEPAAAPPSSAPAPVATTPPPPPTPTAAYGGLSSYTPPRPTAPPPPARSKSVSSGPSLMERVKDGLNVKSVAALGILALVGAWFLIPSGTFGGSKGTEAYQEYVKLWDEFKGLRSGNAPDAKFNEFAERAKKEIAPWVENLKKTASSDRPELQMLLFAGRDHFPKMLETARKEPSPAEKQFGECMDNAKKLLKIQ